MKTRVLISPFVVLPILLLTPTGNAGERPETTSISDPLVSAASELDQTESQAEEESEDAVETVWWERETITGNWGGVRSDLSDAGVSIDPYIVLDFSQNSRGGYNTSHSAFRHLFSFNMTFDLSTLLAWESGTVFVDFHNQDGPIASNFVGDYQYVGNYDADGLTQISELWFEYEWLEGTFRTKLGKVDANEEFAYTEFGWEFVHGSASYPATSWPLLPSYPDPATSVNFFYYPDDHWSFGVGLYDGSIQEGVRTGSRGPKTFFDSPSDLFLIGEVGYAWHLRDGSLPGRLALGGWYHTGTFEKWDGSDQRDTGGLHVIVDQMLWRENPTDEEEGDFYDEGIGFFFQFDYADEEVSDLDVHLGAGLTWRGMLPDRDDDLAGVFVSYIHFTNESQAGFLDDGETAVEIMYQAQITPAATLQPYVQYISNPGGVGLDDAVNIGFRSIITF